MTLKVEGSVQGSLQNAHFIYTTPCSFAQAQRVAKVPGIERTALLSF